MQSAEPHGVQPQGAGTRGRGGTAICALLLLASLALAGGTEAADPLDALKESFGVGALSGEPSPVALPDLAGQQVTLESQRGRVVMLYFWATW
jgi:hypothetical protein